MLLCYCTTLYSSVSIHEQKMCLTIVLYCQIIKQLLKISPLILLSNNRTGHLRFVVLQCSSKSYFQANITIQISHFWSKPIKITYLKSNSLNRRCQKFYFSLYKLCSLFTCFLIYGLCRLWSDDFYVSSRY